jgi:acetyl coenzyme A synthetase (ADP forming)-like protein
MYSLTGADRAEAAFAVADDRREQGLGTLMLGELAQIASSRGVRVFEAVVLPENHQMLSVFRESGFPIRTHTAPGEIKVEFPTELTLEALEHFDRREWTAAVNAVRGFFHPRSVAVIGASRQRSTIGGEVLHNLLSYGLRGSVLPVNPNAPLVQGVAAYASVEEIPAAVDLAVIVVPAKLVLEVAEACGRKGVRALVVISAGFAETGAEGRSRQNELVRICRAAGMRLVGPNCMGVLNTDPEVRLNATFAPAPPPEGRLAFMSQSGALGLAIMDYAGMLGLGLSTFASVGNKADISGNDLVRYWEQDPKTDAILLYLESFGNPRKFSRIARQVARVKPIVAVKSGRSPAGARAAGSHTGALLAASDLTVDALFRQAGVIRTDTLEEMFDVASLLANQPPPRGRRVAILTNAGGPGILCADTCVAEGLEVGPLAEETRAALRALLPAEASVSNPVDMLASAPADHYQEAIRILGQDPNVDSLVVIFIPPLVTRPGDVAQAIVAGAQGLERKPVLTVFMQSRGTPAELRAKGVQLPSYAFPEAAARALAHVARYGEWLARPSVPPAHFEDVRRDEAAAVIASALTGEAEWLGPEEGVKLLSCYGLPTLEQRQAATIEEAARHAEDLGGLVALKGLVPGLIHKTEAEAVRLNLNSAEVPSAAREMATRLRSAGHEPSGFLVQQMAPAGLEMIVGVVHDRQFGPVVACGVGGVLVELMKDVSVRLTPLSKRDAQEMIAELRTYPLLTGYRGGPAYDVPALAEAILRVGAMVEDLPQIAELDLNPILVHTRGVVAVDARVRVAPAGSAPPLGGLPAIGPGVGLAGR